MIPIIATTEGASRYGRILSAENLAHEPNSALQWWPGLATFRMDGTSAEVGLARVTRGSENVPRVERHRRTSEFLIPFLGDILVPVSMPEPWAGDAPSGVALADAMRVIHVRLGTALMLDPGVWHAPAFPIDDVAYYWCLLRRGTGASDIEHVPLDEPRAI